MKHNILFSISNRLQTSIVILWTHCIYKRYIMFYQAVAQKWMFVVIIHYAKILNKLRFVQITRVMLFSWCLLHKSIISQRFGEFYLSVLPTNGPQISGERTHYLVGDEIDLNCTSGKSYPASELRWLINDREVTSSTADLQKLT